MLRLQPTFSSTSVSAATSATTTTAISSCFISFRQASKASGGYTQYQARPSRTKDYGFKVFLNQPAKAKTRLLKQICRYDHQHGVREPEYQPGNNVVMDPKLYDLTSTKDGIPSLRPSKINPSYVWVDVEPDIQKVYRANELRKHFKNKEQLSFMSVEHNRNAYSEEFHDLEEPDWRQRVMKSMKLTEQYPDPNLLTRGVTFDITPRPRFYYE